MSGGASEYVMGNMVNSSGQFYSSGAGFTSSPEAKYYDSYAYEYSKHDIHNRGKLGDATRETLRYNGGDTVAWYGGYTYFVNDNFPWFGRGGSYAERYNGGLFNYYYLDGKAYDSISFRIVLTAP